MAPSTRSSRAVYGHFDPGPEPAFEEDSWDPDVEMTDVTDVDEEELSEDVMERDPVSNIKKKRLVIAIDFGTTFSSVAYVVLKRGVKPERITVGNVECIDYPNYVTSATIHDKRYDVPTELWYDYGQLNSKERSAVNGARIEDEESSSDDNDDREQEEGDNDAYHEKVPSDDANRRKKITNPTFKNRKLRTATRYWGFGVRNHLDKRDIHNGEARKLKRFKLNLNPTKKTDHICTETKATLKILRKHGIINNDMEIYEHFLTHLLTHTKDELEKSKNLSQDMLIQFVICVPAKWPMNACRIMQMALAKAVKEAGFSEQAANEDVHNVFMITEPEAAAECILAEGQRRIIRGETVVIIDAGGGTVDAVTYKCTSAEPLRLEAEMEEPDSKLCGASFIDEKFEKKLIELLKNEKYLVKSGKTIESIAQNQTTIFENCEKRTIDVTKNAKLDKIRIEDLRPKEAKHFEENLLELKRKTVRGFFEESLAGVEEVLERQLNRSEENGCVVRKVILTGGFGQSPSLRSRLEKYLEKRLETHKQKIELITPGHPATAVARGAVLRALNKNLGPSRITQSSYGFLVNEPYQPEVYEEHKRTICRIEHADGEKYVDGVIDWIIQVGDKVDNMQEFVFVRKNSFLLSKTKLTCSEQLWMSDNQHPPHYRNTHEKNKGAELVGKIDVDLTFLKDNNLIKPKTRLPSGPKVQTAPQKFWEVIYEVIMIVQGRSIHFEAKWPARANLRPGQKQEKLGAKFVSIAASFKPGTA